MLPRVINAPARSQYRLAIVPDIPRKTDAWLEHFPLTRQCPVGREAPVTEIFTISCRGRSDNGAREGLRIPAEPEAQAQVWIDLPFILCKETELFVFDVRKTCCISCRS